MIAKPGSTLWLLAHEMRLGWRTLLARRGENRRGGWVALATVGLVTLAGGVPIGLMLRQVEIGVTPTGVLLADAILAVIFSLMLSQTLAAAADVLYDRGDLDLLFSSPISPRKVLTVRFAAIALNLFLVFSAFLGPFLIPIALIGHPPWLSAFLVLASVAIAATACGLVVAMGMFAAIGPRRTRTVAQVASALIGAGFFLVTQARNIFGAPVGSVWSDLVAAATAPGVVIHPVAALPLRALLGDPGAAAILLVTALAMFAGVNLWLGGRFAADSAAAAGAEASAVKARTRPVAFTGGAFAATVRKELRLMSRDAALMSQVMLRVLYLLPLAFVLVRNAGSGSLIALPGGAAALTFVAGQVAASLAWITVSAEDAPDLIASAPTPIATARRAKLTAAFIPVAALLVPILLTLIVLEPRAGLAATIGCAAATVANGLINIWYQRPAKRSEFRRRRGSSWVSTLAEVAVGLCIAAATGLAAAGLAWALIPAFLAGLLLLAVRRTDAKIAQALRVAAR
ncbi:hypothetical protein [Phenylobacterium sp.]|uniref:hypothetical protein n=1 Tax=Phenylobacterium sp. TaxID=1871053 RepID=UPI00286E17B2|nr:hypothetical protein [Phenylobacterium sp.]